MIIALIAGAKQGQNGLRLVTGVLTPEIDFRRHRIATQGGSEHARF
jgi:hypothetical protein